MTENKLFKIETERILNTYSVRILKEDEILFEISNWNSLSELHTKECEELVGELNNLAEENMQLKFLINNISDQRDEFHRGARENANRVGKLERENKELKLLVQNWEALDEEKEGQLDKQNQALKKLKKENEQLRKESYGNLDGLNYYQEQNGYLSEQLSDLEEENKQLKREISEKGVLFDFLKAENEHMKSVLDENKQLKQKIKFITEILNEDIGYIESFRRIEEALK